MVPVLSVAPATASGSATRSDSPNSRACMHVACASPARAVLPSSESSSTLACEQCHGEVQAITTSVLTIVTRAASATGSHGGTSGTYGVLQCAYVGTTFRLALQ